MGNMVLGIVSLSIGVTVLANVFIVTIKDTNKSYTCNNASGELTVGGCSWSSAEVALWGLLTIIGIAGMAYGVMNVFGLA